MTISKLIQKEKDRQETYFRQEKVFKETVNVNRTKGKTISHKQSLINFKEYMEEVEKVLESGNCGCNDSQDGLYEKVGRDIQELTKLIEAYE